MSFQPITGMQLPWLANIEYAKVEANTTGDTPVVAAEEGKRILVLHALVIAAAAVTMRFRSNTTPLTGPMALAANGGFVDDSDLGIFCASEGEALNINLGGDISVGGCVTYAKI